VAGNSAAPPKTVAGGVAGATDVIPIGSAAAVLAQPWTTPVAASPAPPKAPAAAATIDGLSGYRWPLPNGRLTLPFGPTPWGGWIVDGVKFHDGIDLATFCGDRIVAAHDGVVLAAGRHFDDYLGWIGDLSKYYARLDARKLWATLPNVVVIDDGNGYRSVYAHLGSVVVKKGQTVKGGSLLGYEGRTGHATGCHLHYGLFSPSEAAQFAMDPVGAAHMKLPAFEIARIDPLQVLPPRAKAAFEPNASASPGH